MPDALHDPEYSWQRRAPIAPGWAPLGAKTEAERRRRCCASEFDSLELAREGGWGNPYGLVYDAGGGFYRFPDGRFAISREYANWPALKEIGAAR